MTASYAALTADLMVRTRDRERALPLSNPGCASRFWLHATPRDRVALCFHGFTAAPIQFDDLGQALHRAGYNVLAPRLPGHGHAGKWDPANPPPLPVHPSDYQTFALQWLNFAQQCGTRVSVLGLSGGGTLAAWLAYARPHDLHRAILFAPFLSANSLAAGLLARLVDTYYAWEPEPDRAPIGYPGFRTAALRVWLEMGGELLARSDREAPAPLFVISSECDRAVGISEHEALFARAMRREPRCWKYRFPRTMNVPHTMLRAVEGNAYAHLLPFMVKAYLESDLTWAEIGEIAWQMTRGYSFYSVADRLHLTRKVSRDMPAMMTMFDMRAIVAERKR